MTLYLISTPIGNLGDITIRAVQALKDVDLIACEDTRVTKKLLSHLGINKPLMSYHDHNGHLMRPRLLKALLEGRQIALKLSIPESIESNVVPIKVISF